MNAARIGLAVLGLALSACGGAQHPSTPTIEDLRRRAAERPADFDAQRALAEGELLMRGGDAARARDAIARARQLDRDDLSLAFLDAIEREVHGDLAAALEGHIEVLGRAARSSDPRAHAFAEVSAGELEGLDDAVDGYAARVEEALAPLHADPGHLGDGARSTIADILIDLAYRRADLARVAELSAAQRCITSWRVAGPIGPRALLGFDTPLAPDADARLAARYDFGPGRGEQDTRDVHARGCNAHVGGGPVGGPGATFAEATLEVPEGGRWILRLETPNAAHLIVDGERVAALDRRVESLPRATYHPVALSAGPHVVRVRMVSRHPNPVLSLSASRTGGEPGGGAVEGEGLSSAYLRVQHAMARGDVVAARERVRRHLHRDGSAVFLVAGAATALNDPLRSSEVRHDTARRLLGWASRRDEGAWYPRLTLAQLEANEGRDVAAIGIVRDGLERWPGLLAFPLQLVDWYETRGWHAQADPMVERARALAPSACRPRRAQLQRARRRHRAEEALEHARALVECDARSDAVLTLRVLRREWDLATEELTRLAALEPEESTIGELQARLEIARSRGDADAVASVMAALRERIPLGDQLVLATVDRTLSRGDEQGARELLARELSAAPEAMMSLRRVSWAIGGGSPIEAFRRDGAEVIRELEASDRTYEEPMVLVFDYTVYRVFDDGSMLELTHNIFRLQSQEAVDAMGEYAVPEGAHMLTLQTVKEDGRRLEPDEIAGKDTISFPSLSPGDYIEFEYVRGRGAPAGYPGGFVGERFYFRNYETPFDLSQLTVVTPAALELSLDPRGQAPETETEERDGLRVYRWTARESRPFEQEPASIPPREFFPSIYWGRGATWDQYVESLRDILSDRDVRDPAADRLVREIVGQERGTPEQHAARIHAWVLENVEDSDDVFGLAPAMLASRNGNRSRVYLYLLRMAGIDAELALARSFASDAVEGALPDDDTYQSLLVRLRGTDGWRWTHAGARGAPFGYIPPALEGMDALMLDASGERVVVGERGLESQLRTVQVDIALRRDGGARVSVVETFRGAGAVLWRNQLEEIPEARLEDQFESAYVANLLAGGELVRLAITGREDASQPLVLRYDVEVGSLAREVGGAWVLPPVFLAQLGPSYARVPSREIPQLVSSGLALDVDMRVRVPSGARLGELPEEATLTSVHGARASMSLSREDGSVIVRRSYRIPRMRIAPEEYPEFARFCRATDQAEAAELRLSL